MGLLRLSFHEVGIWVTNWLSTVEGAIIIKVHSMSCVLLFTCIYLCYQVTQVVELDLKLNQYLSTQISDLLPTQFDQRGS